MQHAISCFSIFFQCRTGCADHLWNRAKQYHPPAMCSSTHSILSRSKSHWFGRCHGDSGNLTSLNSGKSAGSFFIKCVNGFSHLKHTLFVFDILSLRKYEVSIGWDAALGSMSDDVPFPSNHTPAFVYPQTPRKSRVWHLCYRVLV